MFENVNFANEEIYRIVDDAIGSLGVRGRKDFEKYLWQLGLDLCNKMQTLTMEKCEKALKAEKEPKKAENEPKEEEKQPENIVITINGGDYELCDYAECLDALIANNIPFEVKNPTFTISSQQYSRAHGLKRLFDAGIITFMV